MKISDFIPNLSESQVSQLETLADLFLEWNQKLNLSSIRNREGVILKHIVDSLLILEFDLIKDGDRVLDLGTGGGFPGLALAIVYPNAKFVLADSTEKKIAAVKDMADRLSLKNVKCRVGRAEELGHQKDLRENFDVVVARALAKFPTLLEYCLPFVKVGGKFVAYQGPEMKEGWKEYTPVINELSAGVTEVKTAELPIEKAERCFVIIKKMRKIAGKYPRAVGIPKKKPLIGLQ